MDDYYEMNVGEYYQWRSSGLVVRVLVEAELCVDPDDKFYKDYVFIGERVADPDGIMDEPTERLASCQGWEKYDKDKLASNTA